MSGYNNGLGKLGGGFIFLGIYLCFLLFNILLFMVVYWLLLFNKYINNYFIFGGEEEIEVGIFFLLLIMLGLMRVILNCLLFGIVLNWFW